MRGLNSNVGEAVRFISWNVKGMNGPVKRARIFAHLKVLKCEIAFLQETHLLVKDHLRLRKAWVGQSFHSKFDHKSRGVAILVHKKIPFNASKVIEDSQGRFLVIEGTLYFKPVVLVNVYAPNWDDERFIDRLIASIPNLNSHQLIFGGDLNCSIIPSLDRSNPKSNSPSKMARKLSLFMAQIGCTDPWRFCFPQSKTYSFFSHVHHTYSRIDYFFLDNMLLPLVKKIEYSSIVESDHAPVLLDLSLNHKTHEYTPWRFDSYLLKDEQFCQMISSAIEEFMEFNESEEVSSSVLWETLKVVIRGKIISYKSMVNKNRCKELERLIKNIQVIDSQYAESPSPELYKEKVELQAKYELLVSEKTERMLLKLQGFMYEHGEKSGRLLSHQLKRKASEQHIPNIKNNNGSLTADPLEINHTFQTFYSNLYTSEAPADHTNMSVFFVS